ncbi:hypothetical protein HJC23_007082 [Cyclotella cryptica]|uniref:Uncharacterized protein n=1 Tax=Cyclotella cryptica TaxID=29204 RepID=A0ABD3NWA7_9STRA|eukprot:CCRYP_019337-RA/>CCRYP_019337-RA protein AED:0.25 eAED:0.25 QI:386/1/1/1/0.75/0.6/5/213/1235
MPSDSHQKVNDSNENGHRNVSKTNPVERGPGKVNDEENELYDISSMSEEGSIHGSPSFESAIKRNSSNSFHNLNDSQLPEEKASLPELNSSFSFPPSPFSAASPQPLASISNNTNGSPRAMQKPPASPAGSASSAGSPSNNRSQHPPLPIPRFYDSEDDGPGSLVFIESQSTMGGAQTSSPSQQPQRLFVGSDGSEKGNTTKLTKAPTVSGKVAPSVLPYPQRRKMAMGEAQGDVNEYINEKKPPFAPKQSALAEKYRVPQIPPFRSANPPTSGGKGEAEFELRSPQSSPDKPKERKRLPSPGSDRNRPPLAQSSVAKQRRSSFQEVICPPSAPPPPPQNSTPPSDSPDSGFHIRCHSQTSISSLGSNAVDSVKGEKYSQQPPYNSKMQNHGYPQIQPQNYYPGYMHQPLPQQPYQNIPTVNYNDVLGQDIATFLHGERIAAAATNPNTPHPNHIQPPPYWNHGFGGVVWQGHPYQHHIPQLNPEPPPPPLTTVPNMELRRARLPSISDDDWAEELEKIHRDEDEEAYRKREQPNKNEWDYRMSYQHQHLQHNPYPNISGYYNHNPMANYYSQNQMIPRDWEWSRDDRQYRGDYRDRGAVNDSRNRDRDHSEEDDPNERSSLLDRSGDRVYSTRRKNHDDGYHDYVDENYDRSRTDPRDREEIEQRRRKKKKSSRRREKKRRTVQTSDSSEEDETEKRSHARSRKGKGRRYRRKRRDDIVDDILSDAYSESLMSQSLPDRSSTNAISGGILRRLVVTLKLLICNMPLSSSAISLSIVLLGTLWFKWAEEILSSCKEVTFHSSQCSLPEFPGCYFCDEFNHIFQLVSHFHLACSYLGGGSVMLFLAKAMLCWRSFIDEMSSPTTSSPAGLIFMTMAMAFIGKGEIGEMLVILASILHLILVVWFIYMSLAYQTMPDPSWFPNTIGIGLCAVKVWFYYPLLGHFLIAITLMLTLLYFPISLIRVALSEKMSATVSYIQMMCPAVSLHSLAIIMEPSFREERPDISHFQALQRSIYLPSLSFLFTLCIIGMISSIHGIIIRMNQISREEFSPAHAAYSFPLLMHALAVQSYRSGLDFFAGAAANPTLKSALHLYFVFLVLTGTFVAVVCIILYIAFLPNWTMLVDPSNEVEPPPPNETTMMESVTYGESLIQHYMSPPILQANETGVLLLAYDNEDDKFFFVRSRKVLPALGFEPMMRMREFTRERDALKSLAKHEDVIHEGDEDNENSEVDKSEVGV